MIDWFSQVAVHERIQFQISSWAVVFIVTATAMFSLGYGVRSAQPSTIRGMVKWISAFGWVIVTDGDGYVDGSSLPAYPQPKSVGLIWGKAAARRWVCVHQVNPVNSRNGSGRRDITIKMSRYCYYFFAHQHKAAGVKTGLDVQN